MGAIVQTFFIVSHAYVCSEILGRRNANFLRDTCKHASSLSVSNKTKL